MQLQRSVVQHRTKPYSALDISFLAGCKSSMHACTSNTEVEITSPKSCVQLAPLYLRDSRLPWWKHHVGQARSVGYTMLKLHAKMYITMWSGIQSTWHANC